MKCKEEEVYPKLVAIYTFAFGASLAIRAAAALPALFSSIKLMVELIISSVKTPTKSYISKSFPWKRLLLKVNQEINYANGLKATTCPEIYFHHKRKVKFPWTYASTCKSDGHKCSCFHNPRQRNPHKTQKLEYFIFLQRRQQNLISGKGWTCIYLQTNFQFKE